MRRSYPSTKPYTTAEIHAVGLAASEAELAQRALADDLSRILTRRRAALRFPRELISDQAGVR